MERSTDNAKAVGSSPTQNTIWVISAAGSASRLHRGGRQFEPVIAHHTYLPRVEKVFALGRLVKNPHIQNTSRMLNNMRSLKCLEQRVSLIEIGACADFV